MTSRLTLIALLVVTACAPKPRMVQSSDGRIATPVPAGVGWEHKEEHRDGDGFQLTEIKWRSSDGRSVYLAKEYRGGTESLDAICARDWRTYYKNVFSEINFVDAAIGKRSGPACIVAVRGKADDGAPVQLREIYMPRVGQLLLLTAAGPSVVDSPSTVDQWMAGVRFKALGDVF